MAKYIHLTGIVTKIQILTFKKVAQMCLSIIISLHYNYSSKKRNSKIIYIESEK